MRLQDGQVVDFTKDSTPYVDHRFNAAAVTSDPLVQAMLQTSFPTAPVEPVALDLTEEVVEEPEIKFVLQQPYPATLPKEYEVASVKFTPQHEVGTFEPAWVFSKPALPKEYNPASSGYDAPVERLDPAANIAPWPYNNFPLPQYNTPKEYLKQWDLPSTQQVIADKAMPSNLTVQIQSRIDALSSLEDTTMEIVATIRTLKWVLSEINK
jgi:hypothetical protein